MGQLIRSSTISIAGSTRGEVSSVCCESDVSTRQPCSHVTRCDVTSGACSTRYDCACCGCVRRARCDCSASDRARWRQTMRSGKRKMQTRASGCSKKTAACRRCASPETCQPRSLQPGHTIFIWSACKVLLLTLVRLQYFLIPAPCYNHLKKKNKNSKIFAKNTFHFVIFD